MSRESGSVIFEEDQRAASTMRQRNRKPVNVVRRTVLSLLLLALGLGLALAPVITNWTEYGQYRDAVEGYEATTSFETPDQRASSLLDAYTYNEDLAAGDTVTPASYEAALDPAGTGVMAILRIPKSETVIPIYHSTVPVEDVHGIVQIGPSPASASRGSSLPVGGPSTHAFLSNVNSLPSSKLFDMVSELDSGDTVNVLVCGEELVYEVDGSRTMSTSEASSMSIRKGDDLMTLVLAPSDDDTTRFVVSAKRSQNATSLYLGRYDLDDAQTMAKVIIANMSTPQGIMFLAGCAIVFFFLARWLVLLSDRAPREIGRLTGDTG